MSIEPLITISIPTFNSSSTLSECLQSLKNQTYKNFEVHLIDGGSSDNTIQIAQEKGVKEIFYYTGGLLGARVLGIQKSRGEYILLLDSDQILEPNALKRAVELMKNGSDMLVFEEEVWKKETLLEKLFSLDRKLIHAIKDFNPMTSVLLPRFYRKNIIQNAVSHIPQQILQTGGQDHAILYYEAYILSQKVDMLASAVKHMEPDTFSVLFKKFYRWGYTSTAAHSEKYTELLRKKERFRKGLFQKRLWKESIASIVLLILKGIPYKVGFFVSKWKKVLR